MHTQATPQQIQTLQQQVAALTSAVQLMARIKGERLTTAQVVERIGRTRHDRRGHWRKHPSGKIIWVKPCKVGDATKGVIFKDYKIGGEEQ